MNANTKRAFLDGLFSTMSFGGLFADRFFTRRRIVPTRDEFIRQMELGLKHDFDAAWRRLEDTVQH